ncbi:murein transglycosylase A [Palleronia abyssalis]|uniref:peptidoglycan lytic exotransglycosylase n=1 Tax=Palleronia abyssalis TaxID=1501240 RepID=A0A2R8BSS7_9RHOB|nr:MltA domain-containing protein [Palleronia abyssalis]SPJ23185.1 Membrane-bound lytic murein transglycosylase A [Palleronia abyssalis]
MRGWMRAACFAAAAVTSVPAIAQTRTILEFADLQGWAQDRHSEALSVFLDTCRDLRDPDWQTLCATAAIWTDAKLFFELHFRPVLIEDGKPMLFTGYYEPELLGSRYEGGPYQHPLYELPEEAAEGPWLTRAEIEGNAALEGKGLEIAWLTDPVDVYFLQVQGSGRVRLDDGTAIRVGYGGKNGHSYRSIGAELIRRGEMTEHEVNADRIRDWVKDNGDRGRELLHHNPSYVFFREVSHVPADQGPLGAMNRSITGLRSIAVDPDYTPLGAPVWIETDGAEDLHRLMIAQDTGAAVKGAQRADIFFGTGKAAGKRAGAVRESGRMIVLLPIQRAYALAEGI